jgi:hypothetical protein
LTFHLNGPDTVKHGTYKISDICSKNYVKFFSALVGVMASIIVNTGTVDDKIPQQIIFCEQQTNFCGFVS